MITVFTSVGAAVVGVRSWVTRGGQASIPATGPWWGSEASSKTGEGRSASSEQTGGTGGGGEADLVGGEEFDDFDDFDGEDFFGFFFPIPFRGDGVEVSARSRRLIRRRWAAGMRVTVERGIV